MTLVVQKYGGSSVVDAEVIKHVAKHIVETKRHGHNVAVVVSAMGDTIDDLLGLTAQVTTHAPEREIDMLLSVDERISMSLLAVAVSELGETALSFTGQQAGVHTDDRFGKVAIVSMIPERIARSIDEGNVAVVVGFRGVNKRDNITTLGRGGSDTTTVALAASLRADMREIYTDVGGLFTADPHIVPVARRIHTISFGSTPEMAAHGAKILHLRAMKFAHRCQVPLHAHSSLSKKDGTWIPNTTANSALQGIVPESALAHYCQEETVEDPVISGIAHDRSQNKLTLVEVPDKPGSTAYIFGIIAEAGANIDIIMQDVSTVQKGATDLTITISYMDAEAALVALEAAQDEIGYAKIAHTGNVGKLSLIGAGVRTSPGVSAKLFGALSAAGINIDTISTSGIRLSVLVSLNQLDDAVRTVHTAFGLNSSEVGAVVHGGTGR